MSIESPNGPVPLNSIFYIDRPPIESQVFETIHQPGSIIRIKAPNQMGKSSLINRVIAYAKNQGYYTVLFDFKEFKNISIFSNLNQFLYGFCQMLTLNLKLPSRIDDYWDEDIGSKVSFLFYLQSYILEQLNAPLLLALKETNELLEYPEIAKEFFSLLRCWYEEAKQIQSLKKMRLILVHSTTIYLPLNVNQSPFNIGLPITLPAFKQEQVQDLAQRYHLDDITHQDIEHLMDMVGGHPYLVRLAFHHLANFPESKLEEILQNMTKLKDIYGDHLQEIFTILKKQPEILKTLKQFLETNESIYLDSLIAYQLESLGIVNLEGFKAQFSCQLYRLFFQDVLT